MPLRSDLKFGMPGFTHEQVMKTIELYGRHVIPRVRELLEREPLRWRPR